MAEEKGLLIVYTGPGKGKTTCALGTAFRAVGQGLRVLMVQFIKGSWHYGELDAAKMLGDDKFEIRPMGRGFVKVGGAETDPEDIKMAHDCWQAGRDAIYSGKYDLVVLDEINYTISYKMMDAEEVAEALRNPPERVQERILPHHRISEGSGGESPGLAEVSISLQNGRQAAPGNAAGWALDGARCAHDLHRPAPLRGHQAVCHASARRSQEIGHVRRHHHSRGPAQWPAHRVLRHGVQFHWRPDGRGGWRKSNPRHRIGSRYAPPPGHSLLPRPPV